MIYKRCPLAGKAGFPWKGSRVMGRTLVSIIKPRCIGNESGLLLCRRNTAIVEDLLIPAREMYAKSRLLAGDMAAKGAVFEIQFSRKIAQFGDFVQKLL